MKGCLFEGDVQHHEKLNELHNDLLFLPKRVKTEKGENPVANLPGKTEYVTHKRNLNLALNYGFFKKVHREDEVSQYVWIKPYIDMNKDLRKKKNDFEKDFLKLMNNAICGKTRANVTKHRDIKLVTTERNQLVSEPNSPITRFSTENLLAMEMKIIRYFWINLSI